jgi:lipopolysaccharide export system protein LptA
VQIIQADSIVGGNIQDSISVQKILGDVHMKTEKLDMYADSAYRFAKLQKVQAFGNIEIDASKQTIWGDTLTYYSDIDFSKLRGRVIIRSDSDSTTIFCNSVDYRFTNKVAHFRDSIRMVDPKGVLVANTGFYFRQADSAAFRGQVQLRDSLKYIEGDTLYSNRRRGYYEMHGNVFANDPANNSMLKGDYLQSDSTGRRLLIGHAWLKNYKEEDSTAAEPAKADSLRPLPPDSGIAASDSTQASRSDTSQTAQPDTTHIRAFKILSIAHRSPTDTTTTVKAYKNVRIWSPDFSALSDTARYESKTHTFEVWSNAKAWHKHIQLTGPYIRIKLKNGDIKKLVSYTNPFTVQEDTTIDRLNQIKGDTVRASFVKGQLSLIRVYPHSHLLRFTKKEGKPDGIIEVQAPLTKIFFDAGKLVRMKALGQQKEINGNYLPESEETAKKRLDGFTWDPKQRPQRPREIMRRRFPPIPKGPLFKLPKRYLEHIQER